LIDCHSICTAMAAAYFDEDRPLGTEPERYYATGRLDVSYRRPAPIDSVLELEAQIAERFDRGYRLECRLSAGGRLCAVGRVEALAVPRSWMGLGDG